MASLTYILLNVCSFVRKLPSLQWYPDSCVLRGAQWAYCKDYSSAA